MFEKTNALACTGSARCLFGAALVMLVTGPPAGAQDSRAVDALVRLLAEHDDDALRREVVTGMLAGLQGRRHMAMPPQWPGVYAAIQRSGDAELRDRALELALLFDDPRAVETLRRRAADPAALPALRDRAIGALVARRADGLAPLLLDLMDDPAVRSGALRGLAEFDHPQTAGTILARYAGFDAESRQHALQTLASRPAWALALLDAVEARRVPRSDLTAFTARQLSSLGDSHVTERAEQLWGALRPTPADKARLIDRYRRRLDPEALRSANLAAGREIYRRACANCHRLFELGADIGPPLSGAQRTNLAYLLENIIDPSATVAKDYQMQIIATDNGRIVTGLVVAENAASLTVQTVNEKLVIPAGEIVERAQSNVSMMPEGSLNDLTFEQVRDLIGYLSSQ